MGRDATRFCGQPGLWRISDIEPRRDLVQDRDVYALTHSGEVELREAGTSLSPTELEVLVLIDSKASVAQLVKRARGIAPEVVRATLGKLLYAGHIGSASQVHSDAIDAGGFFDIKVPAEVFGKPKADDHAEADTTVTSLQQQGYYVRIARRAAVEHKPLDGAKLTVMLVDDDADLGKMLRTYLVLEGFAARMATNRDEIVAAFRQPPVPDLVLLDVMLPDADGFEVLAKMRQHPALKDVPVIMLTAKATRDGVLKGLLGGADGYVTKPFEIDTLMRAVRAVLGLGAEAGADEVVQPDVFGGERDKVNADYRKRLAARLQRIERLQNELVGGIAPAARLADLHRDLHTIAGSADMFGLPAATQAARTAEALLELHLNDGSLPGPEEWARVRGLIAALRQAGSN